jgi:Fic family protein
MARANGAKIATPAKELLDEEEFEDLEAVEESEAASESESEAMEIEDCLNALKTLLSAVEKLQKVRQEVGDIKPLLVRMLDGEVIAGDELDQLKLGVGGLFKLVRAYSDHQTALANAQPARQLLDDVLKVKISNS